MTDVADLRVVIKIRHIYTVMATVVALTLAAATGWFALKADVAEAKKEATTLRTRVTRIECLVEQQLNYQIYKIKPIAPCSKE